MTTEREILIPATGVHSSSLFRDTWYTVETDQPLFVTAFFHA